MSFTTATLTGTYKMWDGVTPAQGTVEIIPNSRVLIDAEGDVILSGRVKVKLGHAAEEGEPGADADGWVHDGAFSVTLPATDDNTVEPATGRQYAVSAKLKHQTIAAVTGIELVADEVVDMSGVQSAPETAAAISLFLTAEEYAAVVDRVAALEGGLAGKLDTVQREQSSGVAGLTSAGKLYEVRIPDRLSDASLSATYARFGPTPQAHGAKGDGVTNDTAALQAWLAAGYTEGFIPPGTYLTAAGLVQPVTMSVTFAQGATIKASAAIAGAVWTAGTLTSAVRFKKLIRPTIDCNNLATIGLSFPFFGTFTVESPRVISSAGDSIVVGDPAATSASYELSMSNVKIDRPNGQAVPAGSRGIWMRYAQDSRIFGENSILGADIGIRMDRGSNQFQDVHVWGYAGFEPTIAFDDASGHNVYYGCMADSPKQYGWKFSAFKARLFFCHAYIGVNYPTLDNVVTGMFTTLDAPDIDLIGCHFEGGDGTHRLAKDFDGLTGLWVSAVTAIGTLWDNVVTKNIGQANQMGPARFRSLVQILADNANALGVRDASGAYVLNVNTNTGSKRVEVHNGSETRGYSDAGSTLSWRISGATGAIRPGRATTAGRPTGAALTTGDTIFDVTLQTHVYWDGTNWRKVGTDAIA